MENQILDDTEISENSKTNWSKIKEGLPILILIVVSIYSIAVYIFTDAAADISRIIGVLGVFASALIYYGFDRIKGLWFLTGVLFLSLFGLVKLTSSYFYISIFGIDFPPFPIFLFLFTLFWSYDLLQIGFDKFKKISWIKKIIDSWYSLPK